MESLTIWLQQKPALRFKFVIAPEPHSSGLTSVPRFLESPLPREQPIRNGLDLENALPLKNPCLAAGACNPHLPVSSSSAEWPIPLPYCGFRALPSARLAAHDCANRRVQSLSLSEHRNTGHTTLKRRPCSSFLASTL